MTDSPFIPSQPPAATRRAFLGRMIGGATGLMIAGATSSRLFAQDPGAANDRFGGLRAVFDFRKLAPGVFGIYNLGGNSLLVVNDQNQCLVSDCKHIYGGVSLRREIEALGHTIAMVVNTHHHLDHTGGTFAFNKDLKLIAHANLTPRVRAQVDQYKARGRRALQEGSEEAPNVSDAYRADLIKMESALDDLGPDDFTPDRELRSNEMKLHLGDEVATLNYVTNGHTDNDIFLYLPKQNVMHTGDLLFHELHPYIDVGAGASTRGWQKCLDVMIQMCNDKTVVLPGHGEITDVSGLKEMSAYFDDLREVVSTAMKNGKSRDEITQMQPDVFAGRGGGNRLPMNLGIVYDELANEG